MKQLGSLILPDTLVWSDQYHSAVEQTLSHTVGGVPVVFAVVQQRPVTLVAGEGSAWLDLATVTTLQAMAAQGGDSFPLVWEDHTYTVAFRHQQTPAVNVTLLWPDSGRFSGTIALMML